MKKFAVLAILALSLAGCTRYAALPPDQALSNAVAKILEAKSFSASLDTKVDKIPVRSQIFSNTFLSVAGHFDVDYTRRYADGDRLRLVFDAHDATQQRLAGELRFAGHELFFRLDELPDTGDLDPSNFTKEEFELPLGAFLPGFSTKLDEFSPLERAAAATVIRDTPDLFTGIQEIGQEDVEGRSARHLSARLNPDALERIAQQLAALGGSRTTPRPLQLESISDQPLDLWVSVSGELVRVRGPFQGVGGRSGTLDLTIHNYNDRTQVEPFDHPTLLDLDELTTRLGSPVDSTPDEPNEPSSDQSQQNNDTAEEPRNEPAPGVDTGNSTTPYVPEVPFPIQ